MNQVTTVRDFIRMMTPLFGLDGDNQMVTKMVINAEYGGLTSAEITMLAKNKDINVSIEPEANNATTKRFIIEVREIEL